MRRGIDRRGFLKAGGVVAGAAVAGAAGWTVASPVAWARSASAAPGAASVHEAIVRDARMEWRRAPTSWQDAPFLGNGFLGVQVYRGAQGNQLKIMLSHSYVQDQRDQWEAAIGLSRLPIGFLTLTTAGTITEIDWKLDLWDAELSGTFTTTQGSITFSALVHNDRNVLLVAMTPSPGEEAAEWGFEPLPSHTTRTIRVPEDYVGNPDPTVGQAGPVHYAEQSMLAGGGYTTAWAEKRSGTQRMLVAHVAYSYPRATSRVEAISAVRQALAVNPDTMITAHRTWWNRFYPASLVSVPDKFVQRYYYSQLYKIASATRDDAPVTAIWGPWFPETGNNWTAVWWNTNVQAAYLLINGSNHPELDAVTTTFRRYHENLEVSVPEGYRDGETYALSHPSDRTLRPGGTRTVGVPGSDQITDQMGNLIWGLHNAWLSYRHTMDTSVLREVIYPILGKAVNLYAHFLTEGSDGFLHLPTTRSPEYTNAADCTYDLSLIRWGCRTLVESAQLLDIDDPRRDQWEDILERLVPYHENDDGVLIGDGVPLAESHRHYSHLLWIYPLREKIWDRSEDRELMRRTFDHWASMQERWHGYSYGAASSMAAVMDRPEEALQFLTYFLDGNVVDNTQLMPNTMYREGGNFAIESPLALAQSVLDMLVQSAGGVVKVFPAVSGTWPEASVAGLRTEGAFVVDASRSDGGTEWVRVRSEAGEPLVLQHGIDGDLDVVDDDGRAVDWTPEGPGTISVDLRRQGSVIVKRQGSDPDLTPRDVEPIDDAARWGLPEPPPDAGIAVGKPASQSSLDYGGVPERAVDGNTNGAWSGGSVTHTEVEDQPWWEVDLLESHQIGEIVVWGRTDSCCADRLSDYYVFVSEEPFVSGSLDEVLDQPGVWASHQPDRPDPSTSFEVDVPGRYVRVQLAGHEALSLAEVQVFTGGVS